MAANEVAVTVPDGTARAAFEKACPGQIYLGAEVALIGLVDELLALRRHAAELERGARLRIDFYRGGLRG